MRDRTAVLAIVAIGLTLIMLAVAACDGIRGRRSWRDWWRSLR